MTFQRHVMTTDGTIRIIVEREWVATGSARIAHNRSTATVTMHLTTDGDEVGVVAVWHRDEPYEGERKSHRWTYRDSEGGRWSVEFGYDGRFWCMFGPGGTPWGHLLTNTIAGSLVEATEYIARTYARAKDFDRAAKGCAS